MSAAEAVATEIAEVLEGLAPAVEAAAEARARGYLSDREREILEVTEGVMLAAGTLAAMTDTPADDLALRILRALPLEAIATWIATLRDWQRQIRGGAIVIAPGVDVGIGD